MGAIVFSPREGLLSDRYLEGIPELMKPARDFFLKNGRGNKLAKVRSLESNRRRARADAEMAVAWVLRILCVTSALVGTRLQVNDNVAALKNLKFSTGELK